MDRQKFSHLQEHVSVYQWVTRSHSYTNKAFEISDPNALAQEFYSFWWESIWQEKILRKYCCLALSTFLCENISKHFFLDFQGILLSRNVGLNCLCPTELGILKYRKAFSIHFQQLQEQQKTFNVYYTLYFNSFQGESHSHPCPNSTNKSASTPYLCI